MRGWANIQCSIGVCRSLIPSTPSSGPPGSKVGIVVKHKGSSSEEDLILTRQEIKIQAVSSKIERKVRSCECTHCHHGILSYHVMSYVYMYVCMYHMYLCMYGSICFVFVPGWEESWVDSYSELLSDHQCIGGGAAPGHGEARWVIKRARHFCRRRMTSVLWLLSD